MFLVQFSVDTLKYDVPIINLSNLVKWDEYILKNKRSGPNDSSYLSATSLGIKEVQNLNQLNNLLKENKNYLLNLCKKKNFFKKANDLAGTFKTLGNSN